jgi:hypothetical protein
MANSVRISQPGAEAQATWVDKDQEDQGSWPVWSKNPMRCHLINSWEWRFVPVILAIQWSTNRNIMFYVILGIKWDPTSKISNKNGLVEWLKWKSCCLANAKCKARLWVHTEVPPKKKKKRIAIGHILFMILLSVWATCSHVAPVCCVENWICTMLNYWSKEETPLKAMPKAWITMLLSSFCFLFVFDGLGFELRALYLRDKHPTSWAIPSVQNPDF